MNKIAPVFHITTWINKIKQTNNNVVLYGFNPGFSYKVKVPCGFLIKYEALKQLCVAILYIIYIWISCICDDIIMIFDFLYLNSFWKYYG